MLKPLVEEASRKAKIAKTIAAEPTIRRITSVRYLDGKDIEPVIKVRKSSSGKAGERMLRKLVVQECLKDPHSLEAESRLRVPMDG
jgi:hypothetical protein